MKSTAVMIILVVSAVFRMSAAAASVEAADSAYARGDYAEAVAIYKDISASLGVSSSLCHNMGNAYAKGGDYGNALACYIRALRLDPSNSEARYNMKYIESKVADSNRVELKGKKLSVDPDSPSFFSSVRLYICREHLSDTLAVWAAAFFLAFIGCASVYIFSRQVTVRKVGFFGGFVMLGLTIAGLLFAFMAASYHTDEGVITGARVRLLSEASAGSKENPVALTRGTRVSVLDTYPASSEAPEWYKVRLNSDFVGWVSASDFEPVGM